MKSVYGILCITFFIILTGCKTEHKLEVDVKPLQVTIDVNIKIDRELENFFGHLDKAVKEYEGTKTEKTPIPAQ